MENIYAFKNVNHFCEKQWGILRLTKNILRLTTFSKHSYTPEINENIFQKMFFFFFCRLQKMFLVETKRAKSAMKEDLEIINRSSVDPVVAL